MVKKFLENNHLRKRYESVSSLVDKGLSEESAIKFFESFLRWFFNNGLLSKEGLQVYRQGIDFSFVLTDKYVSVEGAIILDRLYSRAGKLSNYNYILIEKILSELHSKTFAMDLKDLSAKNISRSGYIGFLQSAGI